MTMTVYSQNEGSKTPNATIETGGSISIMGSREVSSRNSFITPEQGMRFIALDILINNQTGRRDIELEGIWGGSFEIRDEEGRRYVPDFMTYDLVEPSMDITTTIERGELLRGWVTFSILRDTPINGLRFRLNTDIRSEWITISN